MNIQQETSNALFFLIEYATFGLLFWPVNEVSYRHDVEREYYRKVLKRKLSTPSKLERHELQKKTVIVGSPYLLQLEDGFGPNIFYIKKRNEQKNTLN